MTVTVKQNILIVDDWPENLLAMETILEDIDVNIIKANSGEEALWHVLKSDFALIILDVQMPIMDGFETAKLLKENVKTQFIPIIFVTAINKEKAHVFKGYESGAVDYVFKPVEKEILESKVKVFLELNEQKNIIELQTREIEEKSLQLEDDRNKLMNILNTMGNGVCILNKEYDIEYVNPVIEREFGSWKGEKCYEYFHDKNSVCSWCENEKAFAGENVTKEEFFKKNKRTYELLDTPIKNPDGSLSVLEVFNDITFRKKMEDEIRKSLHDKENLLKEIHHRVKNNMMVITSLLKLQSRYVKDEKILDIFRESQNRIRSMASIHEQLYKTEDLARINFSAYIENLAKALVGSYKTIAGNIKLEVNVEDISFDSKTAIYCGLIINELVSNSLKYAFSESKDGKITININSRDNDENAQIIIKDNGKGIPDDFDLRNTESMGMQLVTMFVEGNLNGTVELNTDNGTEFRIKFKKC